MKKINKYLIMGAAISGMAGLTACSSENDAPDAPGNVTAVKTQFALNIPRANGGTRMTVENTQGNGTTFRGLENIHMYTFEAEPDGSSTSTSVLTLDNISAITEGAPSISSSASSKIYNDVTVPVRTKNFLFYGRAPQGNGSTGLNDANNFKLGVLAVNFGGATTATSSIAPALVPAIIDNTTSSDALLTVLNKVAQVDGFASANETPNDANYNPELKKLYDNFITLKAGSANNIKLALQTLYNNIYGVVASIPASKTVADNIRAAITESGTFTVSGDEGSYVLATTNAYPNDCNLPDGAVQLTYDSANKTFSYNRTSSNTGIQNLNATNVCFPASIYYFKSSDLAATAQVLDNTVWPTTTDGWSNSAPWTTGSSWGNEVTATTRTIAMKKNIDYGVASLKFAAKCNSNPLKDKNGADVRLASEGFPVTGILIGGQPSKVGYDFQPANGETFPMVVYDKDVNGVNANYNASNTSATSAYNYTIVLPNEKQGDDQASINIAVEFENNTGADFVGSDGIVPAGGKFYLIGKLDPKDTTTATNNTNIHKDNPAVFMSDYQTTVTVGVRSLANAYNTIPDLRSTQMQLGISVDLTWQTGVSFDITLE